MDDYRDNACRLLDRTPMTTALATAAARPFIADNRCKGNRVHGARWVARRVAGSISRRRRVTRRSEGALPLLLPQASEAAPLSWECASREETPPIDRSHAWSQARSGRETPIESRPVHECATGRLASVATSGEQHFVGGWVAGERQELSPRCWIDAREQIAPVPWAAGGSPQTATASADDGAVRS